MIDWMAWGWLACVFLLFLILTPAIDGCTQMQPDDSCRGFLPTRASLLLEIQKHNKHTLTNHDLIKCMAALRSHPEAVFHDEDTALWQQLAERIICLLHVSAAVQLLIEAVVNHTWLHPAWQTLCHTSLFMLRVSSKVIWCRERKKRKKTKRIHTDSFSKLSFLRNFKWNTKKAKLAVMHLGKPGKKTSQVDSFKARSVLLKDPLQ